MRPDSTRIAWCHQDEPTASFQLSLMDLVGYEVATAHRLDPEHGGGYGAMRSGTDGLVGARNKVVRSFLASECQWLLWLDDDMGFAPDTLERLMEAADPVERPIVGALTFSMRELAQDAYHGKRTGPTPVIYDWSKDVEIDNLGFTSRRNYSREAVVQCSATGSACVLIHRSVFEKIAVKYLPMGQAWYDKAKLTNETLERGATVVAEDLSFCMRAADVGCPTFVHTGVKTTHVKPVWLGEDRFLAECWPEPATEPVAVIVPVLSRPQNARPFMESLRASTGLAAAYFVCDPDDDEEIEAAKAAGARVLLHTGPHGTFAAKANFGYRNTTEPWILLVGDDVIFRPGWYDRALRAAGERFSLVGTNDLSDLIRDLAVHPLIRRSYVDEHGASWDGPGVIAHEGYRHNFVDNEWTAVAQQRGVFVQAPDAVVEHMHPLFKKGEVDKVYEKGHLSYDRDKRLWEKRAKEHAQPTGVRNPQACMEVKPSGFDLQASVAAYNRQWHTIPGIVKVQEDLDRYARIIAETKPDVIVECGTWTGASAGWFASHGVEVITIDVNLPNVGPVYPEGVTFIEGSSTDPDILEQVAKLVNGRRCMVVLDSDHSAPHVLAELNAYADLVSPGCYLVVEDTICRWVEGTPVTELGPLDAVEEFFPREGWAHDDDLQNLYPVSHHPGGWWRRK